MLKISPRRLVVCFLLSLSVTVMGASMFLNQFNFSVYQKAQNSQQSYQEIIKLKLAINKIKTQIKVVQGLGTDLQTLGLFPQNRINNLANLKVTAYSEYSCLRGDCLAEEPDHSYLDQVRFVKNTFNRVPFRKPIFKGSINSRYGFRRSPLSSKIKMHHGVDFTATYGTPVYSSAVGKVEKVRYHRDYGRVVDIRHSKTLVTRYAHLSKVYVSVGDVVDDQSVIGKVGSTGRSTGPHLHFEVRVNNISTNPLKVFLMEDRIRQVLSNLI